MQQATSETLEFPSSPATISTTVSREYANAGYNDARAAVGERGGQEDVFTERFQKTIHEVFSEKISRLEQQGLVEWLGEANQRLRLTHRGIFLANRVSENLFS